jgi:hypothetical protein
MSKNILSAFKFGATEYLKKGAFGALKNNKSTFGRTMESDSDYSDFSPEDIEYMYMLSNTFIVLLVSASIVLGFMAVNKICDANTERGRNTRLGLYALLIFSGGAIGWVYILMWILNIDLCV